MAADYDAVDWQGAAGVDQHRVADPKLISGSLAYAICTTNDYRPGQEIQQVADGAAAAWDGHTLEHLGSENEQGNDEGGKELGNGSGGDDCDAHGQFHGHPPRSDVLCCLFENRPTAHEDADNANQADACERFPQMKPYGGCAERHQDDPFRLNPAEGVLAAVLLGWRNRSTLRPLDQRRSIDLLVLFHRVKSSDYFR